MSSKSGRVEDLPTPKYHSCLKMDGQPKSPMEGWFNIKPSLKGKGKKLSLVAYKLDGRPKWSNVVPIRISKKVKPSYLETQFG